MHVVKSSPRGVCALEKKKENLSLSLNSSFVVDVLLVALDFMGVIFMFNRYWKAECVMGFIWEM